MALLRLPASCVSQKRTPFEISFSPKRRIGAAVGRARRDRADFFPGGFDDDQHLLRAPRECDGRAFVSMWKQQHRCQCESGFRKYCRELGRSQSDRNPGNSTSASDDQWCRRRNLAGKGRLQDVEVRNGVASTNGGVSPWPESHLLER